MKRTRYLANRLATSFTLAVVVPLVIASLIFGWGFVRFSAQAIQTRQKNVVEVSRAYVDRYFNDLLEEIALIGSLTDRNSADWVGTAELICQRSKEHYISLAVLDKNGNEISRMEDCHNVSADTLANRSNEEAFFRALRGELFVGNISFNADNQPVATISFLTQAQDRLDVVIIGRVDLGNIWEPLNALEIGDGGYIYVVDRRGNLVGYRDPELVKQAQSLASIPSVAPLLTGQSGVNAINYSGLLGEDVIGSSIVIEKLNWGLVLEQPTNQVFATRNQLGFLILAVLIGFSVAAVLIALYIARSIVTPIRQLAQGAEAIAREDFSVTVNVDTQDEIGLTANAFNQMTARLRELIQNMEQRVEDRTKALATVAEVSTITSTILETDKLLQEVVDISKERFNLYHAHVYLLDESGQTLVLASGAGEPGRQMVAEGRSISFDSEQSLVARAARERKGVTVNDVTQASDFLPNPLLPNTRSELAVPMLVGNNVIGVFDIQSEQVGRFTDSDINIQTTLAAQVATSIQNVRQYEKTIATAAELAGFQGAVSEAAIIATTDVSGKIETVNDNFIRISKYSREELIGQDHRLLNSGYHPKEFIRNLWVTIANGKVWRGEIRNKAKDGSYYWVDTTISPILNERDKPVKYVAVRFDITQRKELELAAARRSAQVEALDSITQKIQSATTVESALQVTARELGHALGMKPTLVSLEPEGLADERKADS